jgi:CIC family chloride channel protein
MRKVPKAFENAARFFHLESWFRLLLLCVLIGIVAGIGAYGFDFALRELQELLLDNLLFKNVGESRTYWMLMIIPAAGGALVGVLGLLLAPEAVGHGTDAVIRAFHRNKGEIRARIPLVKGMLSILTIGTGGSAGKEGPIVQIGAGFGSTLATWLKLSIRDRRILMLAGVAGGIGAIFKAPLGGALFAAEFLYRDPDFEHDAVIPGVISSVTAYSVFTAIDGNHDLIFKFIKPDRTPLPPVTFPSEGASAFGELLHYAILSLICAAVAFLFVKGIKSIEHLFQRLPLPKVIKPAIGAATLGLFALLLMFGIGHVETPPNQVLGGSNPTHIMGGGYGYLQSVINSAQDNTKTDVWVAVKLAGFLGFVVFAKIIATGLTLGSGGSGGLLFPSIFVGGIAGAAYAKFIRAMDAAGLIPSFLSLQPNARVGMILVGMGGVFAACTKTPIASLVMISEITGSYGLAVPLMMTCASAYLLSTSFTMNEEQVNGMADSPAHRGDFLINVLEEIRVSDVLAERASPPEMIPADLPFPKVLERIKLSSASVFAVVDEKQCLAGVFSLGDIRQIMNEQMIASLIVAGDLATTDVPTVTPETNLDEALRLFTQRNLDELPVVESVLSRDSAARTRVSAAMRPPRGPTGTRRVVGMLSRRDLIAAYHRKLHAIQSAGILEMTGSHVFGGAPEPEVVETSTVIIDDELLARETLPATADASSPTEDMLKEPPDDSDARV